MKKAWSQPTSQVLNELKTNRIHGLGSRDAHERLAKAGPNQLPNPREITAFQRLANQLKNPLTLLLCFTLILVVAERQTADALIIALVVVANTLISYYQERAASRVMGRLKHILAPQARVIRDSVEQKILAKFVVLGDVVLLEAGDRVPADGRLVECRNLTINEAPLTGEALPQLKREGLLAPGTTLADRTNMAWLGTLAVGGAGTMVVTGTGEATELGLIAREVRSVADRPEEITKQINRLGLWLLAIGVLLAIAVLLVGLSRGNSLLSMVTIVVSLLVSMVPEGLPIAVTVVLAVGVKNILQNGAVVRKLAAAETLGSVTLIGVDKTGTLTEDKLTVEKLLVAGSEYRVDGDGYRLSGHFYQGDDKVEITKQPAARLLLELSALSTLATIGPADLKRDEILQLTDPTETALAVVAAKAGFYAFLEEKAHPELLELPYDRHRRAAISVHQFGRGERLIAKGAPEEILKLAEFQLSPDGKSRRLLQESRSRLTEAANSYAAAGYRVIALAYADRSKKEAVVSPKINPLTFVGFLALNDQVRLDARAAIAAAQAAGVKVVMLTGDHLLTARTIAQKVGISAEPVAVHASELHAHSLQNIDVIARLSPEEKLAIVAGWQKQGEIVAMTGDGVNDTPALKAANIGVAIGRGGTDAAQEAADIVLLGNHLSAIVAAIQEGRLIWANLRKIIYYLLSTSVAEALILIAALGLGWPIPLSAVQILWMNLVTDGVTSAALAFEPAEANLMTKKARLKGRSLLDGSMARRILLATLVMTIGTLILFHSVTGSLALARTVALTTMVFFQIFNLFASRSETKSIFSLSPDTNRPLIGLFGLSLVLQVLAVYHPLGNRLLGTVPLSVNALFACAGVAILIIVADELRKWSAHQLKVWAKTEQALETN
ncbi:MAG TPA: HAD-IC family P-type ATPase [Candidatus Saccharimonadales bacterium]|nr:HAD-IC family P-type ATPase [Candidatus Saccharimonadales bacterium]